MNGQQANHGILPKTLPLIYIFFSQLRDGGWGFVEWSPSKTLENTVSFYPDKLMQKSNKNEMFLMPVICNGRKCQQLCGARTCDTHPW